MFQDEVVDVHESSDSHEAQSYGNGDDSGCWHGVVSNRRKTQHRRCLSGLWVVGELQGARDVTLLYLHIRRL